MQGDPAGGEGDPGGDVDVFAPDRSEVALASAVWPVMVAAARVRLNAMTARTGQAVFAGELPRGQVCQSAGLEVGVDLFDDRVPTVGLVRGDGVKVLGVGGGEELLNTLNQWIRA